jgi:uncharacterized OB-fold protein
VTTLLEPPTSDEAAPFWDATRARQLVLPWCRTCERPYWFPRAVCPRCLGTEIDWRPASGRATVYAVSVQHRPGMGRDAGDGPYAVALVDLAEGVRMMTNVLGCDPETVAVGQPVQVSWHALADGRHLPMFEPSSPSAD